MRVNYKNHFASVAGVTFNNEDGESRQEILKSFIGKKRQYIGYCTFHFTTWEDEDAIEVWMNDKMIGYIPRTKINLVETDKRFESGSCLCKIEFYPKANAFVANLYSFSENSAPTKSQEYAVEICCKNNNLQPPTEHTFDSYREWLFKNQVYLMSRNDFRKEK